MRSIRNLTRAFILLRLSSSELWNTLSAASVILRYSSVLTNSYSVGAMRGMIDVPPPITILNPRCPSLTAGRNPTSCMPVIAQSRAQPENAVLILRGID